jgi:predicted cobalt transporter CbtA
MNDALDEYECSAVPHIFGQPQPDPVDELEREERRQQFVRAVWLALAIVLTLSALSYQALVTRGMS